MTDLFKGLNAYFYDSAKDEENTWKEYGGKISKSVTTAEYSFSNDYRDYDKVRGNYLPLVSSNFVTDAVRDTKLPHVSLYVIPDYRQEVGDTDEENDITVYAAKDQDLHTSDLEYVDHPEKRKDDRRKRRQAMQKKYQKKAVKRSREVNQNPYIQSPERPRAEETRALLPPRRGVGPMSFTVLYVSDPEDAPRPPQPRPRPRYGRPAPVPRRGWRPSPRPRPMRRERPMWGDEPVGYDRSWYGRPRGRSMHSGRW